MLPIKLHQNLSYLKMKNCIKEIMNSFGQRETLTQPANQCKFCVYLYKPVIYGTNFIF